MKNYLRAGVVLLVLALMLIPAAARADDTTARAKAQFERGEVQYRLGNFKIALGHYQAALRLVRRPSIVYNIAQCYRQMGDLKKALFNYKLFLSDYKRANPAAPRPQNDAEVKRHIMDLTAKVKAKEQAEVLARAKAEALARAKAEAEARVKAEAAARAKAEAEARAKAEVEVRAKAEAAARAEAERKRLAAGQHRQPPPPKRGKIHLVGVAVANARVYVDRVARAVSPVTKPIEATAGRRLVQITAPGFNPWSGRVTVPPDGTVNLVVTLQPAETPGHKKFWLVMSITTLVLAAGAEATAVVFAGKANEHYRDTPPWEDDRTICFAGHAVAGIMGAASVASFIAFLLSGSPEERPAATATVTPLPGGGAAAVGLFRF